MLSRNVRFEGFDTPDWLRVADVFRLSAPPRDSLEPPVARGGVIIVTTGNQVRKVLTTRGGRTNPREQSWPVNLESLADSHNCRWAAHLPTGALETLADRFGESLRRDYGLMDQVLLLVRLVREMEAEGLLTLWPWHASHWVVPSAAMVDRSLDLICARGKSLLLGAFENGRLATALGLRRGSDGFDWVLGPSELRHEMGLVSGDWTRDYRHLARAAETRLGPLAIGCYGELENVRRVAAGPPGSWAAAVGSRDVIVSPLAPALTVPLGVDIGRAALEAFRHVSERLGASTWLQSEVLSPALNHIRQIAGDPRDLTRVLGFNPLELLRRLRSHEGQG